MDGGNLMYICSVDQMRSAEAIAAQRSSFLSLMENAGRALADEAARRMDVNGKKVLIFCGKGNNGGDGFAAAKYLSFLGADVTVVLMINTAPTGIAGQEFTSITSEKIRIIGAGELSSDFAPDVLIDAVFGTGFRGELPENVSVVLSAYSSCKALKIAADIPSGINADTGTASRGILVPDVTVTFGAVKTGMTLSPAKKLCGEIVMRSIGIEERDFESVGFVPRLYEDDIVSSVIPKRHEYSHKGSFGKLLIIGGSSTYSGAVKLSVKAALRSGAGLVRLASVPRVNDRVGASVDECTFTDLFVNDIGGISSASVELIEQCISGCTTVAFGGGLTFTEDSVILTREIISSAKKYDVPVIIDADGLNCLSQTGTDILSGCRAVLTPHPAELGRLVGADIATVLANRLELAAKLSKKTGAIVAAKGYPTYIVSPDGRVYASYTGNAGLSRGGSGDVLTGIIAGLIASAKGDRIFDCTAASVYLFGKAADITAEEISQNNMLPSDVTERLRF